MILTDDLGWQDIKCYDIDEPSPMETPRLDAFAKQGVMFWQAYSPAPTCSPTRCAIMSGNHPARAQKTHVVGGAPPFARDIRTRMMDPWHSGGMEGGPEERYTDNNRLDRGKISAKEGGTRVPLLIVGPGIEKGVQTDVMINGLDFYPTILSLTGSPLPAGKHLDGCDVSPLLLNDPTNPALVKEADGRVRDTMMWHFPHGSALESTIRIGGYKLIRNYDHVMKDGTAELELFRLYETNGNKQQRLNIEESKNLASEMPERTASMNRELTRVLTEMKASYPSYNPDFVDELPGKESACTVVSHKKRGDTIEFTYQEHGAKVERAELIDTLNGGDRYEEWFRAPATLLPGMVVAAELPAGTTHYILNVIDENNFLRNYPEIWPAKSPFSSQALSATG